MSLRDQIDSIKEEVFRLAPSHESKPHILLNGQGLPSWSKNCNEDCTWLTLQTKYLVPTITAV